MSDQILRNLERRAHSTQAPCDILAWVTALRRTGCLPDPIVQITALDKTPKIGGTAVSAKVKFFGLPAPAYRLRLMVLTDKSPFEVACLEPVAAGEHTLSAPFVAFHELGIMPGLTGHFYAEAKLLDHP